MFSSNGLVGNSRKVLIQARAEQASLVDNEHLLGIGRPALSIERTPPLMRNDGGMVLLEEERP